MKVITLLNEKGGVGKTTLTATIGAGLAIMGYRVLLLDADPQGHLSITLGIQKQPSLYDLFVRDSEFNAKNIIHGIPRDRYIFPSMKQKPGNGRLFIVPGNNETRLISQALESQPYTILERMQELKEAGVIDFVLFDTSPTPSAFHAQIYLATDHIIYPTEVTYLSFDGLRESIINTTRYSRQRQQTGLDEIKLTGIVPTKFRTRTLEHQEQLDALKENFGDLVWNPLPMSVVWEEAMARNLSIFNYAYDHPAASDAWKIIHTVKERILNGSQTQS